MSRPTPVIDLVACPECGSALGVFCRTERGAGTPKKNPCLYRIRMASRARKQAAQA